MQHIKCCVALLFTIGMLNTSIAQGPPITGDKPIMLGENSWVVKTLTELRWTKEGFFTRAPLMVHYLPTSNFLVGLHVPFVSYTYNDSAMVPSIGDIEILAKYQFYRKDGKAKTFRVVAKTIQTIPTGPKINQVGISTGVYSSYLALVAGYESIKYGISNELGYNISIDNQLNELRYKLGFGLPLLKPTYPVKQLNLYFEYQHSWFTTNNNFIMLYAQGIQYAKGRVTVEAAVQFPLIQLLPENRHRNISVLVGTRYVF